jgi:PPK2 family polyphosphate:nucleotide phosphotransferase
MHDALIVKPGKKISLEDYDPRFTLTFNDEQEAADRLSSDIKKMTHYQELLYSQQEYALLIVLQAMDAAGKDGTIKHVMSGVNPQGCDVTSFKVPSARELSHDYLWRSVEALPERGRIGIFNRSYYEELIVVRVHPELLANERIPACNIDDDFWKARYEQINNFEKYLVENGTVILKFFLNISKSEQRARFLARLDTPEKNWKFTASDLKERAFWDDYQKVYEKVFKHTSTDWAPWYIIPADHKWFTRAAVANVIVEKLKSLNLSSPKPSPEQLQALQKAKMELENEGKTKQE